MKTISSPSAMQRWALTQKKAGRSIAFVPTMGALHEGHLSLVRRARALGDLVVVSIYVNPTQFDPKEDFSKYPRPIQRDASLLRREGVEILFHPANLYEPDASTWVKETDLSTGRCGGTRPGHFKGVTTVVTKLFNLVLPDVAVFGQKDAQQCEVITRMVRDLCLPVRLVIAPTLRERDGLAMSSRNAYLTPEERAMAPALFKILSAAAARPATSRTVWARESLAQVGFRVDYVEECGSRLCAAAFLGKTRLLDNVSISPETRPSKKLRRAAR